MVSQYFCTLTYRLLMREVQGSLGIFEGRPEDLFFTYDQRALADNKYFQAGQLTAWSLAHNGPGPRSMNKNLFMMMCGQKVELSTMDISILLDQEQNQKMEEVFVCLCLCLMSQSVCPFSPYRYLGKN